MVEYLPGMQEVVGSNPRGGRNFSHGKLFKINPLVLKSHLNLKIKNYITDYIPIYVDENRYRANKHI